MSDRREGMGLPGNQFISDSSKSPTQLSVVSESFVDFLICKDTFDVFLSGTL